MAVPLRDSFHLSLRGHQLRGHTPEDTIAAHERIFERIQAGDARGAAQAMRSHLREAVRDVSAALNASMPSRNATAAPGKRPDPRPSPPGKSHRGAKRPKRG
jgi:hypothetical protein